MVKNLVDLQKAVKKASTLPTTELLHTILQGAVELDASDVHFEPQKGKTRLRLRIDGILQDILDLKPDTYSQLTSRIKLISGIKLNITDSPQDGRFSVSIKKTVVEIRVSTIPARQGESIVLRILNPKNLIEIGQLGLRPDLLKTLQDEIKKKTGMIIVTGPTGSGKTTTLYAVLQKIARPSIKIITIEDPVEYHVKGISQTQTNPKKGYDFAAGLKSVMRQDPDVILVGEIRDLGTVNAAMQAALTGHLVLSTLHANDAAGTIARLVHLGAKPANIGPALNMALAQRLVREICPKCSTFEKASSAVLKKIKNQLRGLPRDVKAPKLGAKLKIPKAKGCKDCNHTGYRGRIGIFEIILIDDEMEDFIIKSPSIASFRAKAVKNGMVTILQDGLIKVLQGATTLEELERVVED